MTLSEFWLIIGMALATFLCRYPLLALAGRLHFPPIFRRSLNYVGPAVLAAVIAPELFLPAAPSAPFPTARLVAGLVTALVAWRSGSVWLTICSGLLTLAIFQTLLP
jgi:branched-subunit amino acid transport protein